MPAPTRCCRDRRLQDASPTSSRPAPRNRRPRLRLVSRIALPDVRAAAGRIHGRVLRTPVRRSEWLSGVSGGGVHLKLEIVQTTGSYKIRGALNAALRVREGASG